eukprot:jgi/Ulvmu1/9816/UM056_0057.1
MIKFSSSGLSKGHGSSTASQPYATQRLHRAPSQFANERVRCAAARTSVSDLSSALRSARSQAGANDELSVFMSSLQGAQLSDADFAEDGQTLNLLSLNSDGRDADAELPLTYDPEAISDYWSVRPTSVVSRMLQLMGISSQFLTGIAWDIATGQLKENEVKRAIQIRRIVTSLGPAYIKLGQALSIRPDLLSPAAMNELQKLCDKVPSFDNGTAMAVIEAELGRPWQDLYAELSPNPIAAASLGQVYRGRLHSGEEVAVKVQRPGVLETVTIDLFIIRRIGQFLKRFPDIPTDFVALLDEWAARFFEELDYVREGENATKFAEQMKADLPQVVVAKTYSDYTARRVLTVEWLEGEKLSQSTADDVGTLVNLGVICYLKQLLDTGFFHADPHPGNLIRTPDGRLAILDFGLMTQVDDDIKFGMIEAISHLIHRDYEAIVKDFVTLQFIPKDTDLRPILPVLANVFDQALEGGGAKNINFQELAADLAEITFEYPFRIPPYFALIIRAISVLEGIALVGNREFAIIDEAFPYLAQRLLTDDSPRLRESLRYMVYGRSNVLDVDRLIELLSALETFTVNSRSAGGDLQAAPAAVPALPALPRLPQLPLPLPPALPVPAALSPLFAPFAPTVLGGGLPGDSSFVADDGALIAGPNAPGQEPPATRAALQFMLSEDGTFFRSFLLDEIVSSIDAFSRSQLRALVERLDLVDVLLPLWLPGAKRSAVPLALDVSDEDRAQVESVARLISFLAGGSVRGLVQAGSVEVLPLLPRVAGQIMPEVALRLTSRVAARFIRYMYV